MWRKCAACIPFQACSCGGQGLSSQGTLMPLDAGRKLDGITGNWIVFHLLWRQPGGDIPSPTPLYLQLIPPPPTTQSPVHSCSHPITEACYTKPLLLRVTQTFPLQCRNAGLNVSREPNKAAAHRIPTWNLSKCGTVSLRVEHCMCRSRAARGLICLNSHSLFFNVKSHKSVVSTAKRTWSKRRN